MFYSEKFLDKQTDSKMSGNEISFGYVFKNEVLKSMWPLLVQIFLFIALDFILIIPKEIKEDFNKGMNKAETEEEKIDAM